jgi:uncharacterized membrane protein YgdD (TMEM256/DUF423 family)
MKGRLLVCGFSGAMAVALGAWGAHGLKQFVLSGEMTADQLSAFDTGVRYQMYHTLAMLFILVLIKAEISKGLSRAYLLFGIGIILFSGSLYLLSIRNILHADWLRLVGPVTPIGGLCFVAGWISLAFAWRKNNN